MQIKFWAATDTGLTRDHNEDNYLVDRKLFLFIVADGMGGHAAGEVASSVAVHKVREVITSQRELVENYQRSGSVLLRQTVLTLIERAILEACHSVHKLAQENSERHGMGTTLSLLLIAKGRGFIGHVGDSRIYMTREDRVTQVTEDHSVINELIKSGRLKPGDAYNSPYKNAVTRAVGVHPSVEVDTYDIEVKPGDQFLLCSDGLSCYLDDPQILDFMSREEIKAIPDELIVHANASGGKDNITAIVVRMIGEERELRASVAPEAHVRRSLKDTAPKDTALKDTALKDTALKDTASKDTAPQAKTSSNPPPLPLAHGDDAHDLKSEEEPLDDEDSSIFDLSIDDIDLNASYTKSEDDLSAHDPLSAPPPIPQWGDDHSIDVEQLPLDVMKLCPLFSFLSAEGMIEVSRFAEMQTLNPQTLIYREGNYDEELYLILSGEVRLERGDEVITILMAGSCLGEDRILSRSPNEVSAISETSITLLSWSRYALYHLMSMNHPFGAMMMWGLAQMTHQKLQNLQRTMITQRELEHTGDHPISVANLLPSSFPISENKALTPLFILDLQSPPTPLFSAALEEALKNPSEIHQFNQDDIFSSDTPPKPLL
jgi:serine/threonine protein phosphatase PrpC/CRP-like cAMP-binding protein